MYADELSEIKKRGTDEYIWLTMTVRYLGLNSYLLLSQQLNLKTIYVRMYIYIYTYTQYSGTTVLYAVGR